MDYGDIFKRGFLHTWNNKFLYLLGFLAALGGSGGGGGGGGNFNTGNLGGTPGGGGSSEIEDFIREFGLEPANMESFVTGLIGAVAVVVCILVVLRIVLWFVRMIAEAGMIQAVVDLENGIESNFRKAFGEGRPFLMTIFISKLIFWGLPIVLIIISLGLFLIPIFSAGFTTTPSFDETLFAWFIPFFCVICLLVPYGLVVNLIFPLAQRGIVLKGMDALESVGYGWETLKSNLSDILILAFLYTVVGFIVGIISLIIIGPIILATGWPVLSSIFHGSIPSGGAIALLGVGILAAIIIGSIVNAVFIAFRSSSFTLAYIQLDGKSLIKVEPEPAPEV
ncbi:MAG: hypothetical protein AAGD96_28510 [Chloroflexota bacterium]